MVEVYRHRDLIVPDRAEGMRLDRFLAARFLDRSRASFAKALKAGLVRDEQEHRLRASTSVRAGDVLRLYIPGLAPTTPPPPVPPVLWEDDRVIVLNKPAGMMAHPAGTEFTWAVVGLARAAWPEHNMDLVHRLDQYTSGIIVLSKDVGANRYLKGALLKGQAKKHYVAICRGVPSWDTISLRGPIGPATGVIRIQMAQREDGALARTDVEVLKRHPAGLTLVKCHLFTGRTHQIRVHLAGAGFPLLGDRMYGVGPEVFLDTRATGALSKEHLALIGAPRHALHAARITLPHPDGGEFTVEAPMADDMASWWRDPEALPWSGSQAT